MIPEVSELYNNAHLFLVHALCSSNWDSAALVLREKRKWHHVMTSKTLSKSTHITFSHISMADKLHDQG